MEFIGFDKVQLIDNEIVKEDSRIQLDFNAIAKGYAVDYLSDFLKSKSYKNYLVDIGGEVYAAGIKPDSSNWQVGVETPIDNASYGQDLSKVLSLKDKGMATSGNYRRFFEKDGKKYVHTINPKTGETVNSNLLSVTVICKTTAEADAYATAMMSMGLEKAIEFSEKMNIDVFFIFAAENGEFDFYISPEIEKNISN
jgi:thiamine biosynthesis lipoprotein